MGDSIKAFFNNIASKGTLARLILINVTIFVVLSLTNLVFVLFEISGPNSSPYIELSSNVKITITHIWTLFTYMFVHYDFFHILFNMLMLYWFGQIFLMYFSQKQLRSLYILGGLSGAIFYIIVFNTIPYFMKRGDVYMVGASASVMAIIFGSAFYNKNLELRMLLIGRVKIIYIALFIFLIDFISLGNGSNLGGHIAHIGGAAIGYLFAVSFLKGKDITKWLNIAIDKVNGLFKPKPRMKVTFNKKEADYEYNERKHNESERVDMILDKIKKSGYGSLTDKEKKQLFDASNK